GIDANLAEIHRTRVNAIDAGPGFAGIGRFVDATVLEPIGALLGLHIFALAAIEEAVRAAAGGAGGAAAQRQDDVFALSVARDAQRNFVIDLLLANLGDQLLVREHGRVVYGEDDVAGFQACFLGGAFGRDLVEASTGVRILAGYA